jgi:3-hydroxybutyryl-CoA dehydrogenase
MTIEAIGVIGAGVMGAGVAQNFAQAGHQVFLIDVSKEILERAKARIEQSARFQTLFLKGAKSSKPDAITEKIIFSTDYQLLENADFVIENVTENWEIKEKVYRMIDPICPEHVIFAANTSAISITRIGSATRRAPRIVGTHFMNPVPLKQVVEVIRGFHTSEETIETTRAVLARVGKECVVVNDSPGFVSNRVLMLTINEAIFLLQERVASTEEIDRIFKTCFGHKMGPLETADLIGLDTILYSIEILQDSFKDDKFRPCPLLKKMVDAGLHGQKSGQGFYEYRLNQR